MSDRDFSGIDVEMMLSMLSNLGSSPSDFRDDLILEIQAKLNREHNDGAEANLRLHRRFIDMLTDPDVAMLEERRRRLIGFRRRSVP